VADPWASAPGGITGPITRAIAVTPSDATNLTDTARALYVGGAGNVVLLQIDGTTVTLNAVAVGVWHPIRFNRVNATSTTATAILAGY
jgi:hypothetical protein